MTSIDHNCCICKKDVEPGQEAVILTQKGADGINRASKLCKSDAIASVENKVHVSCRRRYTDTKTIKQTLNKQKPKCEIRIGQKSLRSSEGRFIAQTDCLFCGNSVDFSGKRNSISEQVTVQTTEFAETIKQCCETGCDEWSLVVKGRIEYSLSDLHAADCVYYRICSTNFRTGKNIPQEYACIQQTTKKQKLGRPIIEVQQDAFLQTCTYLEANDEEQLLLTDLVFKMEECLKHSDCEAYSRVYMKRKLEEHYEERVVLSHGNGKTDIVTLKDTADHILRSYHAKPKDCDLESQRRHIIEAAARLIKSDVKAYECKNKDTYPSTDDICTTEKSLDYLPDSLRLLCTKLFVGKDISTKVGAIGQSIMQAKRSRALICPLQIGLDIQMHHNFRSRYIIDVLHQLGFSSSYIEVLKFEGNAALTSSSFSENVADNNTILFAADNVDHNIRTLDGNNTFHGMGMIAAVTPRIKIQPIVSRYKVNENSIKNIAHVTIQDYRSARNLLEDITFQNLEDTVANIRTIDILWQLSWSFLEKDNSNWSGMMQTMYNNSNLQHPGKTSISFLPIINLAPSNMTCILSTLLYLNKIAQDQKVPCIITFDQPLYWKASQIIHEYKDLEDIVLMLGSFHTLMNVVGAIGTLMKGSGLNEVLQEIYGPNAVLHVMTGKAISRAVRGHMIVDAALSTLIMTDVFPCNEDGSCQNLTTDASILYDSVMSEKESVENVESSDTMREINNIFNTKKLELQLSQTSTLWLEYQEMVQTVRKLSAADRTSPWKLQAIQECLVIVAAVGHHNYLKSGYKYLQDMLMLPSQNPTVYEMFLKGLFVVRRSERFWAGLGSDLVIEQVLMRSIKCRGGLTRGSGLTEIQQATWLKSMPVCSLYNIAMQEYTKVSFETSEQHKEVGESRRSRDIKDFQKVLKCIKPISPFDHG